MSRHFYWINVTWGLIDPGYDVLLYTAGSIKSLLLFLSEIHREAESTFDVMWNSSVCVSLSPSGGCAGTLHQLCQHKEWSSFLKVYS